MLRLSVASLVLLGAATSVVANPSPAPEPFFLDGLKDRLADLKDHLTETAHNLLGQKSCPIPALLPAACKGTVSIAESRKNLDECCSEIPGGRILLTQFYNAQPSFGPEKEWTIHGLWPDNCDGSWEQYCDVEREYDNIREILTQGGRTDLLEYMDRMWKSNTGNDQSLWSHEWNKHGTCMSTLNPECYGKAYKQYDEVVDYFEKTVSQDKKLPTYEWLEAAGIVPSETATYTLEQLQAVAKKNHGYEAIWGCNNKNELDEVWYQYIARGPIAGGKLIPAVPAGSPSSCPATGIKYLPKTGSNNGGSDGGSNNGGGSDNGSTGEVAAKVFWNVEREGNQEGCLISKGTWYTTGTCATYYLYPVDESVTTIAAGVEFTMTSSKGPCSLDTNSQLVCASGNTASTFSVDADNSLTSAGSPAWYAAQVASGSTQVNVATEENTVALTIKMGSPHARTYPYYPPFTSPKLASSRRRSSVDSPPSLVSPLTSISPTFLSNIPLHPAPPPPAGSPPPYTAPLSPPLRSRSTPSLANLAFTPSYSSDTQPAWTLPPSSLNRRRSLNATEPILSRPSRSRSSSAGSLYAGQPLPVAIHEHVALDSPMSFEGYAALPIDEPGSGDDEALEIQPRAISSTGRRRDSGGAPLVHRRTTSEQRSMRARQASGGSDGSSAPPQSSTPTPSPSPSRKRSRIWTPLLGFLQLLAVLPGLAGFFYSAHRFWSPSHLTWLSSTWEDGGTGVGITSARSTRLDWFVSGMWALATAYFTFQLARGLLRRWLVYYSMGPTIIRVISLQAICWPLALTTHRVLSFDQPVAAWCACATTAAISNVIQTWVTSNIVERKDRRNQQRWRIYSAVVTAVLGPGIRTDKYRKGERVVSWKRVLWGTVLPFALLSWSTSAALLWQQFSARYHGGGGISLGQPQLNATLITLPASTSFTRPLSALPDLDHTADIRIVILVTSSWTNRSLVNRHTFRETSVRLFPRSSASLSIAYRFLLGAAPSPQTAARCGPGIEAEADEFGDMLVVPAHDDYEHLSQKIFEGWKWASGIDVDYVLKTDDDIMLRMDVLGKEFVQLGRRKEYWRGFAYWDIPAIKDASNKNADFSYDLATFPPYTAGALHILSKDLVDLITPPGSSRIFVKNEDQNLGIWLYPSGIRPIHDPRIQQAQVCENDMVAKHFGSQYVEPNGFGPREMYANVVAGRKQCEGLLQSWCGVCYASCRKRRNHWREWGFACDDIKGATLSSRPSALALATGAGALDQPVKVPPEPFVIGSADDPWIIPGLLSRHGSPFSSTDDWHLLHMLCWTTGVETFQERHYQALETIWAHEPRAILFMFSTTLPDDFFDDYRRHGFAVHVIRVGKEEMLKRRWFLGPSSEGWLQEWDKWEKGPSFFSHLTDYLRYLFLFKFGGTYLDMDAPWIRSPPDSKVEFIGADYSTLSSDLDWTLDEDGMYLAPGVMRFRRGWTVFRDIMESAFSAKYSPDCFNCVGPRAITSAVRSRRHQLEQHGFTIVPPHVLYPRNWVSSHELVRALPPGEGRAELSRIARESWSIHLFGKMTNHLRIQPGSVVAEAFDTFSLRVPRRTGLLSSIDTDVAPSPSISISPSSAAAPSSGGLELRFPPSYTFRARTTEQQLETPHLDLIGSLDGRFDGLDLISLRGVPSSSSLSSTSSSFRLPASIRLSISPSNSGNGVGRVALLPSSARLAARTSAGEGEPAAAREASFSLMDATLRDVNAVLAGVVYLPPLSPRTAEGDEAEKGEKVVDELVIEVKWGEEKVEGRIRIEVPAPPALLTKGLPSTRGAVGLGMELGTG